MHALSAAIEEQASQRAASPHWGQLNSDAKMDTRASSAQRGRDSSGAMKSTILSCT
jgi:hypothetical protein